MCVEGRLGAKRFVDVVEGDIEERLHIGDDGGIVRDYQQRPKDWLMERDKCFNKEECRINTSTWRLQTMIKGFFERDGKMFR